MPQHYRIYDQSCAHFITCTVIHWIPVFCRDDYFRVLADSLAYCSGNKGLRVHGYVIMPNHFHLICSQSEGRLSDVMRDMKRFTSIEIAKKLETDGRLVWLRAMHRAGQSDGGVRVWDEAFHPEQIHTKPFFEQKLAYIHNNPLRAGYVDDPCEWRYSSASAYYREAKSVVPIVAFDVPQ